MNRKERKALPDHFPYEDELGAARGCIWWTIAMVAFWTLVIVGLSGCSHVVPYAEGGVYHSSSAGYTDFDETGLAGSVAAGIEFRDKSWYVPSECGFYHRSMITQKPEAVINDWGCRKRIYFGGRQ